MAIITDPDLLSRFDVIFNTASQAISIYPVGDTQRNGSTYTDVYVATSGTLTSGLQDLAADFVVAGDVVGIQNDVDGGHYYVESAGATTFTIPLAEIDTGFGGAETTSLTVQADTYTETTDVTGNVIDTTAVHGLVTGDAIVAVAAGTIDTGLTQNTVHYVIRISTTTLSLAATFALAVAGTALTLNDDGTGVTSLHKRLLVGIFTNGANSPEAILGFDTSGDGLGDVADGITQQATYSFGKEEWRVDSLETDLTTDYADDLIRHQFPFEAITSEQFEVGGGTSHDNWNWFNSYTRKKVRTAGFAEKTDVGTGDLARETGIITLGSIDSDAQVYFQQTSIVTPSVDFTFLGPVNEALKVYDDPSADNTPESDLTTFLKLFVRKKGRSYSGSQISDIGVTTITTIVNRFPLAHVVDTAITLTDANLLGLNPYKFATAPVAIESAADGNKTAGGTSFTSTIVGDFAAAGVVAGDILHITEAADADGPDNYYEITTVATTTITVTEFETVVGNDFTFGTGWAATNVATDFEIFTSVLTPAPGVVTLRDTGVLVDGTATNLVDVSGVTGTLTDAGGVNFTTDGVAAGDYLILSQFYDIEFNALSDVDLVTADTITEANHNLRTGDRIVYDDNSLTTIAELVSGRVYYAAVETSGRFWVCNTLADAWTRHYGDSDEITLTPGVSETHAFHVHEGDGYYKINTVAATLLTVDTDDYQFPTTAKTTGTNYRVVEAGMYLQFKDKTVNRFNDTQTTTPLTDLDFTIGTTIEINNSVGALVWDYLDDTFVGTDNIQSGDIVEITGSTSNDGRYTVLTRTDAHTIIIEEGGLTNDTADQAGVTISVKRAFERTLGSDDVAFNWKVSGNGGTLQNVYEFVQSELRSADDIDQGAGTEVPTGNTGLVGFIGDINDLLMSFASPTGTGLNMIIDDLNSNDINNATFNDHGGTARTFPFTSAGSLVFNPNLTNDSNSNYWLFFTNDLAADTPLGLDYGTENAIIVNSSTAVPIFGSVNGTQHSGGIRSVTNGTTSITFTYAYGDNVQRGTGSNGSDAPVTLIAIGAPTAQFVIATGTITQAVGITISAVAALERNYNGSL